MDNLRELIKAAVLERKSKIYEEDLDDDGIEDTVDPVVDVDVEDENGKDSNSVLKQIVRMLDSDEERLASILRGVESTDDKLAIIDEMIQFLLNNFNTRSDLPNAVLRNHFLKMTSQGEKGDIEEMSTTAGAPAPATKYAFKLKKK